MPESQPCAADHGSSGDQRYVCSANAPVCVGYIYNKQWGHCVSPPASDPVDLISSIKGLQGLETKLYGLVQSTATGNPRDAEAQQQVLGRIGAVEKAKTQLFSLLQERHTSAEADLASDRTTLSAERTATQLAELQFQRARKRLSAAQQALVDRVRLAEIRDYEFERMNANRRTLTILVLGLAAIAVETALGRYLLAPFLPQGATEVVVGITVTILVVLLTRRITDAYSRSALDYAEFDFGKATPGPGTADPVPITSRKNADRFAQTLGCSAAELKRHAEAAMSEV